MLLRHGLNSRPWASGRRMRKLFARFSRSPVNGARRQREYQTGRFISVLITPPPKPGLNLPASPSRRNNGRVCASWKTKYFPFSIVVEGSGFVSSGFVFSHGCSGLRPGLRGRAKRLAARWSARVFSKLAILHPGAKRRPAPLCRAPAGPMPGIGIAVRGIQ